MPRGQYDRSHLKAKRAAVKAAKSAATATVAAGIAISKANGPRNQSTVESYRPTAGYVDMAQLREQLNTLVDARFKLCANQVSHNDTLIGFIDGELTSIVRSMATWRESLYPSTPVVAAPKTVPVAVQGPQFATQGSPPPAPLPFTPQAVHEAMKSAGQA